MILVTQHTTTTVAHVVDEQEQAQGPWSHSKHIYTMQSQSPSFIPKPLLLAFANTHYYYYQIHAMRSLKTI
jgi:hypothetical protein